MEYFYLGIALIPLMLVGCVANLYTLYCLVKRKQRIGNVANKFGNLETLLLALTISDTVFCLGNLPVKTTIYLLHPAMKEKPRYLGYMDAACFWSSSLIIILIAANNYIKISRPQKYHQMLSRRRIQALVTVVVLVSVSISLIIFPQIRIFGVISVLMFLFTITMLSVLYFLISRTMKYSQARVDMHAGNNNENNLRAGKKHLAQRRVTKNILVLVLAYFVCCLSVLVCLVLFIISPSRSTKELVKFGTYVMSLSCIIDPCVYVLKNKGLGRKTLKRKVAEKTKGTVLRESSTRDITDESSNTHGKCFLINKEKVGSTTKEQGLQVNFVV